MGAAAIGVGMALSAFGQIKSNMDQAKAEARNAKAFEEQAQYAREVNKRKLMLLERQQQEFRGRQKTGIAKAGISFSGSIIDVLHDTLNQQSLEKEAAQMEAEQTVLQYTSRAEQSRQNARALRDPLNNILPIAGSALSTVGKMT